MTTMAARKAARKPSVSPTSRGPTQPTPTMRIRRLFNPLATRLGLFLHWAFTPDTDHEIMTLQRRVDEQQCTIWRLQERLNGFIRESRLLRAQLENVQDLIQIGQEIRPTPPEVYPMLKRLDDIIRESRLLQFGHATEPNQDERFSAWDGGPLPPGKSYRV